MQYRKLLLNKKGHLPEMAIRYFRYKSIVVIAIKITFQNYLSLSNAPNSHNKKERPILWMRRKFTICSCITGGNYHRSQNYFICHNS